MDDMAPDPVAVPSNIFQSIRSSCDRCRFYKLRCDRSSSAVPTDCERCTRAKAPCVFGRRQRARASKRQTSVSTTLTSISTSPTAATTTAANTNQIDETYTHAQSYQPPLPTPPTISYATPSGQSWDNEDLMLGMHHISDHLPGQENGMNGWVSMQQDFNLNDAFTGEADPLDPSSWLPSPDVPDAVPGQRLVTLMAKMQQCLQILEHGPWQNDSANSLDDYPVGTVLHLSQEFSSIASPVLSRCCIMGTITPREYTSATENTKDGQTRTTKPNEINGESDTVTTLLVLSGYMSLARIYSIVLGHFQTHLSSVPSNHHSSGVHSASTNPTMQLGELPSTGAAPVLGKIHTALRMLLAALHGVEEKLGPGGAVARNLVVALLAQEAVLGTGEFHGGLSRKMQLVKELLQEKMNL